MCWYLAIAEKDPNDIIAKQVDFCSSLTYEKFSLSLHAFAFSLVIRISQCLIDVGELIIVLIVI